MKNVTISPYKEVATWARIRAAELGTSVSRLVGGMLNEKNARTKKPIRHPCSNTFHDLTV